MKSHVRTLQIAFTYIGTIVGAGFATGQEILKFFTLRALGSPDHPALNYIVHMAGYKNDGHCSANRSGIL